VDFHLERMESTLVLVQCNARTHDRTGSLLLSLALAEDHFDDDDDDDSCHGFVVVIVVFSYPPAMFCGTAFDRRSSRVEVGKEFRAKLEFEREGKHISSKKSN